MLLLVSHSAEEVLAIGLLIAFLVGIGLCLATVLLGAVWMEFIPRMKLKKKWQMCFPTLVFSIEKLNPSGC